MCDGATRHHHQPPPRSSRPTRASIMPLPPAERPIPSPRRPSRRPWPPRFPRGRAIPINLRFFIKRYPFFSANAASQITLVLEHSYNDVHREPPPIPPNHASRDPHRAELRSRGRNAPCWSLSRGVLTRNPHYCARPPRESDRPPPGVSLPIHRSPFSLRPPYGSHPATIMPDKH